MRPITTFLAMLALSIAARAAAPLSDATPKAWRLIKDGLAGNNLDQRAQAVQALGLLPDNPQARDPTTQRLKDPEPRVRAAAAAASVK